MSYDVQCPYCGKGVDICRDDGFGLEEDRLHHYECPYCEKTFVFVTGITVYHTAFRADCLNGAAHQYHETATVPSRFARLRCDVCGNEKDLSPERQKELNKD